jgi:hypothetical protein
MRADGRHLLTLSVNPAHSNGPNTVAHHHSAALGDGFLIHTSRLSLERHASPTLGHLETDLGIGQRRGRHPDKLLRPRRIER